MKVVAKSNLAHIEWIDLNDTGVATEVAVVKRDQIGNCHFIRIDALDAIDKKRLRRIVSSPNAPNFALWQLMEQTTLGNGMNSLVYFHQLVKVVTPSGQIITPSEHSRGYYINPGMTQKPAAVVAQDIANAKRGPGRPKAVK